MKNIGACGGTMGLQAMPTSCGWSGCSAHPPLAAAPPSLPRAAHNCGRSAPQHSCIREYEIERRGGYTHAKPHRNNLTPVEGHISRRKKKARAQGCCVVCGAPRWWPLLNKYISVNAPVLLRAHHSAHFSDIPVFVHSNPLAYPAALTRAPRPRAPRSSARSAPAWPRRLQPRPRTSC